MNKKVLDSYEIDYIEQYVPMAKPLVYWHIHALGFEMAAYRGLDNGCPGYSSYLLRSNNIKILLTSVYPFRKSEPDKDVQEFVRAHHAGVKRIVLRTASVGISFSHALERGAIPLRFPNKVADESGFIEEAAIRLYDDSELVFLNREQYKGVFLPGFKEERWCQSELPPLFVNIDHVASELRMNQMEYWTKYLRQVLGINVVQQITRSDDNNTGMLMNIGQSPNGKITIVIAEPESAGKGSRVQQNIDNYGPGIHHIAFATEDIVKTVKMLTKRGVEMVRFPPSYYELLRSDPEFEHFDIDEIEEQGILIDKDGESYLLQKFMKPYGDRPFFIYEIVQRVNGYHGFAIKNINTLKKAEERELMKVRQLEPDATSK